MTTTQREKIQQWIGLVEARADRSARPSAPQPIAITGAAGFFPGAQDLETFWRHIDTDSPQIGEIPPTRFDWRPWYEPHGGEGTMRTKWGGFIPDIASFDPALFGMLPAEADETDPRLRLLLMAVWRTLEDAGVDPRAPEGPPTGVFIGCESNEYLQAMRNAGVEPKGLFEQADSMLSNRISRFFDFRGPSEIVNTMCSGFTVALHRAVSALSAGHIDRALVGAANVMLSADMFRALSAADQLSTEPTVRSFGECADGYVRAEGAGAVLLERGDRVDAQGRFAYAHIRHVEINHAGRGGSSIATPDIESHADLLTRCYLRANIDPRRLGYIEAQGMGVPVADVAEWTALNRGIARLYQEHGLAVPTGACRVSTLKPLIGHMHAASGLGALLKVIRSFQTNRVHKVIGFTSPNAFCEMARSPCRIVTETEDWPAEDLPRLAALHSFGSGGNNAHVVMEEVDQRRRREKPHVARHPFALRHCWFKRASGAAPARIQTEPGSPRSDEVERQPLLGLIREAMRVEPDLFDPARSFADQGVDSLSARIVIGHLNQALSMRRPATDLYNHPSPLRLAAHLEALLRPASSAAETISAKPDATPDIMDGTEAASDDIAICGIAMRTAGADDHWEFWSNLCNGVSAIAAIPPERLGPGTAPLGAARGGFIRGFDRFDPGFFGISPREAALMDPRHRLLLQTAYAAIEDSGHAPSSLAGTRTGIFLGLEDSDYPFTDKSTITSTHTGTAPARIGYLLDLEGPVLALSTACSSSLVAIHYACKSILSGESDMALAGGCTLFPDPGRTWRALGRMGNMLSPDGTCYAFDRRANGMVLGEAVGVIVLKRLAQAVADDDVIYGVIKGSGVNYDGRTNGLTAPSAPRQQALYQRVSMESGVPLNRIGYVVAHGTGTALGDPIECSALIEAHGRPKDAAPYCALTSVKPGIGHTLAASGVVNLITAAMATFQAEIPPTQNFQALNEDIVLDHSAFYLNSALKRWDAAQRYAAVSAFGHTGTNAHVIVGSHATSPLPTPSSTKTQAAIVLSAQTPERLRKQAARLLSYIKAAGARAALNNIAWTLQVGRDAMPERLAFVADSVEELGSTLEDILDSGNKAPVLSTVTEMHRGGPAECDDESGPWSAVSRWVKGEIVNWAALQNGTPRHREHLPSYSFDDKRYWLDETSQGGIIANSPVGQPTAELLHQLVAGFLHLPGEHLDPNQPLETYGLDSLMVTGLIEEIRRYYPQVDSAFMFRHQTVSAMAAALDEAGISVAQTPPVTSPPAVQTTTDQRSVRCLKTSPRARTRLLVFHPFGFGDGSLGWTDRLSEEIEVWCVGTTAALNWEELTMDLAEQVRDLFDMPTVLWGHSMGAIVAFEVLHYLETRHGKKARQFVVSSAAAPQLFARLKFTTPFLDIDPDMSPDQVADILIENQYLAPPGRGLPALPAGAVQQDVALFKSYEAVHGKGISAPIFMIQANTDVLVQDPAVVLEWRHTTTGACRFETIEGTHMFFVRPPPGFVDALTLCCLENPFKVPRLGPGAYRLKQVWSGTEDVRTYPLGTHPRGMLLYGQDGVMAAHLWHPKRSPDTGTGTRAVDYFTYIAYGGRYEIDRGVVSHRVEASLKSDLQDKRLDRFIEREGGALTLQASPVLMGLESQFGASDYQKVRWERCPPGVAPDDEIVGAWTLANHTGLPCEDASLRLGGQCLITADGLMSVILQESGRPPSRLQNFALVTDEEIERMLRCAMAFLGRLTRSPQGEGLTCELLVRQTPFSIRLDRLQYTSTDQGLQLAWPLTDSGPVFTTTWSRTGEHPA